MVAARSAEAAPCRRAAQRTIIVAVGTGAEDGALDSISIRGLGMMVGRFAPTAAQLGSSNNLLCNDSYPSARGTQGMLAISTPSSRSASASASVVSP